MFLISSNREYLLVTHLVTGKELHYFLLKMRDLMYSDKTWLVSSH